MTRGEVEAVAREIARRSRGQVCDAYRWMAQVAIRKLDSFRRRTRKVKTKGRSR